MTFGKCIVDQHFLKGIPLMQIPCIFTAICACVPEFQSRIHGHKKIVPTKSINFFHGNSNEDPLNPYQKIAYHFILNKIYPL